MRTEELVRGLEELAPPSYAESWDNVGLLIGSPDRDIQRVYVALDADSEAIDKAAAADCQLILTHHPLLFSPVKSIRQDDFIGKRLLAIIENRMNYYAMHTNFDVAVMADLAAAQLGLGQTIPLVATCSDAEGNAKGIGCVGELEEPTTLAALAARVKEIFDLPQVRYYGNPDRMLQRTAMCPGSGKGMDEDALAAGAQVFITGDIDHHYGLDAVEKGLCMIDAGHHGLEHIFVPYMKGWLAQHFSQLEIITDRNVSPFRVV